MDMFTFMSGLQLACIYGLLAIGVSIIWASLGMLNLAHGFTFAAAGFGAWLAAQTISTSPLIVFAAGILTGALSGLLIFLAAFLYLHDKPNFQVRSLIATMAINMIGVQLLMWWFGPRMKPLPRLFGSDALTIGGVVLTYDKFGTVVCAVAVLGALLIWLGVSRRGVEIRAMMQNPEGAALVGISLRTTALWVMALTGALAGLAAVLLSQTFYVSPYAGLQPLIKGLIVALLGGLGSISGAVVGAIVVGFTEALTVAYLGGQYVLMTQFAMIIVILLFRPRGLGGLLDEMREE
ncbi:MAG: branched-chain amino acid ABC transporter permease [Gammaproteobacteria bacterium]